MKKNVRDKKTISASGRWAQNGLFQLGGRGANRCLSPWKGCCAGYWKRRGAWCQGDLWKCRRRPADSAVIVPCLEAALRGYTEALCYRGLPSLSWFLLHVPGCSQSSAEGAALRFRSLLCVVLEFSSFPSVFILFSSFVAFCRSV